MPGAWHDVGAVDAASEGLPLGVQVGDREIGIYTQNGTDYALEDVCPHASALLSRSFVDGEELERPLPGATFRIPTGKCTKEPGGRDLTCLAVKAEGGRFLVKID